MTRVSGFVITYDSGPILDTCLRSLRFVDELIVVDKSSTDATPQVARRWADKVLTVPWSPLPTETRLVAHDACSHDFIVYLDHDECLNVDGIRWVREHAATHPGQVFRFPKCEYVIGRHDPDAYYWPMMNVRAFRRGAAEFVHTLHEEVGLRVPPESQFDIPLDSGVRIHNLSHRSTHQWIEKSNRYTDEPDRVSTFDPTTPLDTFAQERVEFWLSQSRSRSDYVVSAALLRAVYDIVDRVKLWEQAEGIDGDAEFAAVCAALESEYDAYEAAVGAPARPDVRRASLARTRATVTDSVAWRRARAVAGRAARRLHLR